MSALQNLDESHCVDSLGTSREWLLPLAHIRSLYFDTSENIFNEGGIPGAYNSRASGQHDRVTQSCPASGRTAELKGQKSNAVGSTLGDTSSALLETNVTDVDQPPLLSPSSSLLHASTAQPRRQSHAKHPRAGPSSLPIRDDYAARSPSPAYTPPLYVHPREARLPYPAVRHLLPIDRRRILVTGGAGFLGSHLVDRLMLMGHDVMVLDNFFTGQKSNVAQWIGHPNFELVRHDVVNPIMVEVDHIYHLACPASPQHYQANQIKTIKTNFLGTSNMLGLAKRTKARFLLASTSEVYGDPDISPQKETYNGNVNQTGPRACYDEGKRVAETLTYGYLYQDNVDIRVARIFNTYGPRMNPFDGRVVSNLLVQGLKCQPMTIYGDGSQTRSFCFIHDLIDGLIALMNAEECSAHSRSKSSAENCAPSEVNVHSPVNLGNDKEFTMLQLADIIADVVHDLQGTDRFLSRTLESQEARADSPLKGAGAHIEYLPIPVDDPRQRRPDITRARMLLQWQPTWGLREGVLEMGLFYVQQMKAGLL